MTRSLSELVLQTPCRNDTDHSAVEPDGVTEPEQSTEEDASRDITDGATTTSDEEQSLDLPRSALEDLPAELRIRILSCVPDLRTLGALLRASPVYFAQYRLGRKPILAQALQADLGDELLVDVYAAFRSRRSKMGPRRGPNSNVTDFLRLYRHWRSPGGEKPKPDIFSLEDLRWMTWFYLRTVRPLVARFIASALARLESSPASPAATSLSHTGHQELSRTEHTRLLRAFYRFETFCHIFGISQYETSTIRCSDISRIYFSEFEPWEVEEAGCIYDFVKERYEEVLAEVKWDFDERNPKFADDGPPFDVGVVFELDPDNEDFRNGTIARGGLRLAYHMFRTEDHEQLVGLMGRSFDSMQHDFFEEASSAVSQCDRREEVMNDRDRAEERREPLSFAGDDSAQPPLAWVLLWGGKYSNLYGEYVPNELRWWRYVIWDERRLDARGAKEYFTRLWTESPALNMVKEDWPSMQDIPEAIEHIDYS